MKSKKGSASGPVFTLVENPFADLPQDELIKGFVEAGKSFTKEFEESLEKLQISINSVDPFHLLSVLSVYGLFVGMTESGKTQKQKDSSILQPHVELVQALALRTPYNQLSYNPALPPIVREIWDLSQTISKAFSMKRFAQIKDSKNEQEKAILFWQEYIRNYTHMVRNWGYYKRVVNISRRLFKPIDSIYENEIGIGASTLIDIFEFLVANSEKKVNQHREKLKPVFQAKSLEQAIYAYYEAFPDLKDSPERLIEFFQENNPSLEAVFSMTLSHSDLKLQEIYTFSAIDLAKKMSLNSDKLLRALSMLSFSYGDLKDSDPEHFFLGNTVWTKPLIKVKDDTFFCSIPQLFFSFVFWTLNSLIENNESARSACIERRAKFLEDEVLNLMKKEFKDGEYIKNFQWSDSGEEYETDLIYKIDSYLMIIEAKSGAISWPAFRGAPKRMERHIKDLLINPALQSKRLEETLLRLKTEASDGATVDFNLPFDINTIQKIIRVSVTLEDFATIQTNVSNLKSTGWVDDNFVVTPTILLSDLEVVFDILQSTPEKLHYLVCRAKLEENMEYNGDEIDLLGLYLDTGFNLGDFEFSQNSLMLTGMSKIIDRYYIALDKNILRKKPKLKSTVWWSDIIKYIEERSPSRWSEAAVMLLNISYDDQVQSQKKFKKIVKNVKKNWRKEGHRNSVVIFPPEWRYEAVSLFAFRERKKEERHKSMENLASHIFEQSHATRCLIIGMNIDKSQYPYSLLGVFDRPKNS